MIHRLKSRLVSGLIVSTIGMAGATFANAADKPPTTADTATPAGATTPAATATGNPPSAAAGNTASSPGAETSRPSAATAGDATDSPAKKLFDQLDLNRDGTLSLEEFSRATFQQPAK